VLALVAAPACALVLALHAFAEGTQTVQIRIGPLTLENGLRAPETRYKRDAEMDYRLRVPARVPVADFWALTILDVQQRNPTGSGAFAIAPGSPASAGMAQPRPTTTSAAGYRTPSA